VNTLKAGDNVPGVRAEAGTALTIDGTGRLNTTGNEYSAGIGGGYNQNSGFIIIQNGDIHAQGGGEGAGIGGGWKGGAQG
jgi:hypothetical protein